MGKLKATPEAYARLVGGLAIGKRLPDAVYLHAAALAGVPLPIRRLVDEAVRFAGRSVPWNVVKFTLEMPKMSLLWYPRFFEDGFPELSVATTVDLQTGEVSMRSYAAETAPILHRKEAMLPHDHAAVVDAVALTKEAEALGLFEGAREIGYKAAWQARLARVGLRVVGHRIEPDAHEGSADVARHRTALTRYSLSSPVQSLWRHGYLEGAFSLFDYGCGRGDDVRALQSLGLESSGWDPYFAPENEKCEADIVNLGFVLNVIEDQRERLEALRGAWGLAKRLLAVSILIGGRTEFERFRLFRDGVLTARGTFQKYFTPSEFRTYLEDALGREPIAVAPGVAFVFRNDEDEQAFLARRARARAPSVPRISSPRPEGPAQQRTARAPRARALTKWETHRELAEHFWSACLAIGRLPEPDEYTRFEELHAALGQPGTVFRALVRRYGEEAFRSSQEARRNDLLVFLALNVFERRRSFRSLPQPVQRDIRALLGSYQNAQAQAQALLFSTGKKSAIQQAATVAAGAGIGFLDGDHSLQVHSSLAQELPAVLRVYLGCAARLYGDVETADLIKLHIQSGKISIMIYDDFEGAPLPRLIERVKINLRRQEIDFFEYGSSANGEQLLYLKSRFIRAGFPWYDEQVRFDRDLTELGVFDFSGFGPSQDEFLSGLDRANAVVDGFSVRRTERPI